MQDCTAVVFVQVSLKIYITQMEFTQKMQRSLLLALATTCRASADQASIVSLEQQRRTDLGFLKVVIKLAGADSAEAQLIQSALDQSDLNKAISQQRLPIVTILSSTVLILDVPSSFAVSLIIAISVLCAVLGLSITALGTNLILRGRQVTDEERRFRSTIYRIRKRLRILPKDGFLLGSDTVWFWSRSRSRETTHLRQGHCEAAARLELMQDYDIHQFDAFCLCLECDNVAQKTEELANNRNSQYKLLGEWFLDVCTELIRPEILESASCNDSARGPSNCGMSAAERFRYFSNRVIKARILADDTDLFMRLKSVAADFMGKISLKCDDRYLQMCTEQRGRELICFHKDSVTDDEDDQECQYSSYGWV